MALERPEGLDEIGLFDVATFEPDRWTPDLPHSAMANLNRRDGYWAAKVVSAFSDRDLRLLVEQGRYEDPAAAEFMIATLAGRRDKIVRYWFGHVPPLDFFRSEGGAVVCSDLAVERGYAAPGRRYRWRLVAADAERAARAPGSWIVTDAPRLPLAGVVPARDDAFPFLGCEVQYDAGSGWSGSTTAWFARDGRCVAVDR